jgi:hypothetical protein
LLLEVHVLNRAVVSVEAEPKSIDK